MKEVVSAVLASPRFLYLYDSLGPEEEAMSRMFFLPRGCRFFSGGACPTTNCSNMPWPAGFPTPRFSTVNWTGCCPIPSSRDFATAFHSMATIG